MNVEIPYSVHPRPDTGVYNAKVGMWLFLASEAMLFGGIFSAYILLRIAAPEGTWPRGWLSVPLGTLNTLLLAMSAVTTVIAWAACKARMFDRYKFYQGITILLAIVFLGIKGYEYSSKFSHYQITLKDGRVADGHLVKRERPTGAAEGEFTAIILNGHIVDNKVELMDQRQKVKHEEIRIERDQIQKMANYAPRLNTFMAVYFTLTGLHGLHVLGGIIVFTYLWAAGRRMWEREPDRFTNRVEIAGLFWHFVDLIWIFAFPILYLA